MNKIILKILLLSMLGFSASQAVPLENGIYSVDGSGITNSGNSAGLWANTSLGYHSLRTINLAFFGLGTGTGNANTSIGANALFSTTSGDGNTATGAEALFANTIGNGNTANGFLSLSKNSSGSANTAIGESSLESNTTGINNTANGNEALFTNTIGNNNTAIGYSNLGFNATGNDNTALGAFALLQNSTGNNNLALGKGAGTNLTTGDNNIYLANPGAVAENNTIRIGKASHIRTFIGGVRGRTVGANAIPIVIDSSGRLGTVVSSARFKKDIQDMNDASRKLLQLRPVTYHYKQADESGANPLEYGLIAEEVAKVYPDLVAYGADGKIETVQYQKLTPMLLNEMQHMNKLLQSAQANVQKQEQTIKQQAQEIASLKQQALKVTALEQKVSLLQRQAEMISVLTARLAKLESQQMVGFNR